MKRKICVRSMVLGAGIMLIGLVVGAIVSPPLIAHGGPEDLGVFGKVVCRKIEVVDEHDQTMIRLESDPSGSLVSVYNKAGEPAMSLQTSPTGNSLRIYDPVEDKTAITLESDLHTSHVWVHSKKRIYNQSPIDGSVYEVGDRAINLIASEGKNRLLIFDQAARLRWETPEQED